MSTHELSSKAQELQELKRLKEDLDAEITAIEDAIKSHMGEREEVTAGAFKIRWKTVESTRLDSKALKAELPEIATRYSVKSVTRRFSIA